jgi:hypothetical protein
MLRLLYALLATARSSLRLQRELALENLALRQHCYVRRHLQDRCSQLRHPRKQR